MATLTLSKAVEHERGWVATKMGLLDIFVKATMTEINRDLINRQKQIYNSKCGCSTRHSS